MRVRSPKTVFATGEKQHIEILQISQMPTVQIEFVKSWFPQTTTSYKTDSIYASILTYTPLKSPIRNTCILRQNLYKELKFTLHSPITNAPIAAFAIQ